jgi:hypothetical protein
MTTTNRLLGTTRFVAALFLAATLAACGGGGDAAPATAKATQDPAAPANRAPSITGSPPASVTVGQAFSFTPTASDPDGNTLTFSITGKPAWLAFSTTTGALSGTPTATDVGTSTMTITVSDGSLTGSLTFAVNVLGNTNRAPTISGTGAASLTVGQSYVFSPVASDPDGDRLTFGISGKPAWATFDATTGRLIGTPAAADVGSSSVSISVSDGQLQASLVFTITVVAAGTPPPPPPTNNPPVISGNGTASVTVGQAYSFTPTASDPDGNLLTFGISGKPSWATFNTTTGRLSGTPAAANVGTSTVTIAVSDGSLSAAITFTITVVAANRAPTISGTAPTAATVGQVYSFAPTASDPDGNTLTFSITGKPAWLSFSTTTGALTGTPAAGDVGASTMTITVSDGSLTATLSFTVTVAQATGTGSATLNWSPPTTRIDGTALTTLAGYKIYYGTNSSSLTTSVTLTNPGLTSYVVTGLAAGTYFFAMTAVETDGTESAQTSPVSKTIT